MMQYPPLVFCRNAYLTFDMRFLYESVIRRRVVYHHSSLMLFAPRRKLYQTQGGNPKIQKIVRELYEHFVIVIKLIFRFSVIFVLHVASHATLLSIDRKICFISVFSLMHDLC